MKWNTKLILSAAIYRWIYSTLIMSMGMSSSWRKLSMIWLVLDCLKRGNKILTYERCFVFEDILLDFSFKKSHLNSSDIFEVIFVSLFSIFDNFVVSEISADDSSIVLWLSAGLTRGRRSFWKRSICSKLFKTIFLLKKILFYSKIFWKGC